MPESRQVGEFDLFLRKRNVDWAFWRQDTKVAITKPKITGSLPVNGRLV